MLGTHGLLFLAVCFVSQVSARLSVTVMSRDYSYVKPNEVLVSHIQRVLDSMVGEGAQLHPRVRHLYELLRRDVRLRSPHHAPLHALDYHKTLRPTYDVNKLNRIFTTEADG